MSKPPLKKGVGNPLFFFKRMSKVTHKSDSAINFTKYAILNFVFVVFSEHDFLPDLHVDRTVASAWSAAECVAVRKAIGKYILLTKFLWGASTLTMLRLLSSKAQGCKSFGKPFKPCRVGIHWLAIAECSQMSTHVPGFQSFFRFFASFCIGQICHQ